MHRFSKINEKEGKRSYGLIIGIDFLLGMMKNVLETVVMVV